MLRAGTHTHRTSHTPESSVTVSGDTVGETFDLNRFDIRCFHDRLTLAEVRKVLFELGRDRRHVIDDLGLQAEEDVCIDLFDTDTKRPIRTSGAVKSSRLGGYSVSVTSAA